MVSKQVRRALLASQIHRQQNELELWTTLAAGNFAPRVDFPAGYSPYWDFNGQIYPATSGAAISAPAVGGMQRAVLKGVPLSALTLLDANSTGLVGDITNLRPDRFRAMRSLYLHSTSVSGDISGWTLPASLKNLSLYTTSVSGDISGWTLPASLAYLYLHSTSVTVASTFAGVGTGMRNFQIQNCSLIQAHVDNVVESIWNARLGFTWDTPFLNVGGTNAAPAGNVAAPPGDGASNNDWSWDGAKYIPLTAGAMIWDLAKDVNSEGFKKWAITYNGGSI
jgi:hypothetical protein